MMRALASSLFRYLKPAACISKRIHFRPKQTEFPAASQNACRLLEKAFFGPRAAGRASTDALRRYNNSVNLEDQNEISFIREAPASFAWWIPKKGRSTRPPSRGAPECPQENILAAVGGVFRKRRDDKESSYFTQRVAANALGAQT
jgi:hypothetical protein